MSTRYSLHQMERRHHTLDQKIRAELLRPQPDDLAVVRLKKRKLALKDQMAAEVRQGLLRAA